MTPLFACFPVCLMFVGIAILGFFIVVLDVANRIPGDDQPATDGETPRYAKTGPPPWWVMVLMIAVITVTMLVLAWYWPE